MPDYSVINIKKDLYSIKSTDNIPLLNIMTTKQTYKQNLSHTGGMYMHNKKLYNDMLVKTCNSNMDIKIITFLIDNMNSKGEVAKADNYIGINDIAKEFKVTRKKVSELVARAIKAKLVKKNKRKLVINPYVQIPYRTNDKKRQILQVFWDSDFTRDITKELEEAELAYQAYLKQNTPEDIT